MELASDGNLEDYIVLGPGADANDVKNMAFRQQNQQHSQTPSFTSVDRKRARAHSMTQHRLFPISLRKSATVEKEERMAQDVGGIGVNPRTGQTCRFLLANQIKAIFTDILLGLQHLHRNKIVHRDLKPPNLLCSFREGLDRSHATPSILISDFGECELISEEISRMRSGGTGTLEFMPPEVLERDAFGNYLPNHSISIDLWSLGVVLYFICFAQVPFSQTDDVDLLREEILNFDPSKLAFPATSRVPDAYLHLIKALLSRDADARPTVDRILSDLDSFPDRVPLSSPKSSSFPSPPAANANASLSPIVTDSSENISSSAISPTSRDLVSQKSLISMSSSPSSTTFTRVVTSTASHLEEHHQDRNNLHYSILIACLLPCIPSLFYSSSKPFLTICLCICSLYLLVVKPSYSQLLLPATLVFLVTAFL